MSDIATSRVAPYSAPSQTVLGNAKQGKKNEAVQPEGGSPKSDNATTSASQVELTRLSSILSGLQKGASQIRAQVVKAANQVKSGSYQLDALEISKSIVSDLLGPVQPN